MPSRETFTLDFGWRFALGDLDEAEMETFDDSSWRRIDLPHDWSIDGPFREDNPAGGSGPGPRAGSGGTESVSPSRPDPATGGRGSSSTGCTTRRACT